MNLRKLLLLFIALTLSSCTDSITQTHLLNDSEEAVFIPFESQGILTGKAKDTLTTPPSEFGCILSTLNSEENDQKYLYQAFYIQFPEAIVIESAGKIRKQKFLLSSDRAKNKSTLFMNKEGVVRYLSCRIPDSPDAIEILKDEMVNFGEQSWYKDDLSSNVAKEKSLMANSGASNYEYVCRYEPGDGYGNISSSISVGNGDVYIFYYFHEVCSYEYIDDGEVDVPESPSEDPFGGGNGGGIGDPDDPNDDPNPCIGIGDGTQYPMTSDGEIIGCGDEEAILAQQVEDLLEDDEFALIEVNCDKLPKWQNIAQLTPSETLINKLESLDYFGEIDILTLETAAGKVVNMDEFSVTVSQLPEGMSANELFDHIRLNINDFIDTDLSSFSPYDHIGYSYDESAIWNSNNPLGAILSIDIPLPGHDGSVIVSDFSVDTWTFSTLTDPINFDHPVSGNREFGLIENSNGSYTIFTRGVDRITKTLDAVVAETFLNNPFIASDNLWSSFQNGIAEFVNQSGGMISDTDSTTDRPNWEKVKDVLQGNISSEVLGCQN